MGNQVIQSQNEITLAKIVCVEYFHVYNLLKQYAFMTDMIIMCNVCKVVNMLSMQD